MVKRRAGEFCRLSALIRLPVSVLYEIGKRLMFHVGLVNLSKQNSDQKIYKKNEDKKKKIHIKKLECT